MFHARCRSDRRCRTTAHGPRTGSVRTPDGGFNLDLRDTDVTRRPHGSHGPSLAPAAGRGVAARCPAARIGAEATRSTGRGVTMADLGFDGKVAIITGAGGGLGREHALLLAHRGALVVVNDLGGAVDGTGGERSAGRAGRRRDQGGRRRGGRRRTTRSPRPRAARPSCRPRIDAFGRVDIVDQQRRHPARQVASTTWTPTCSTPVLDVHLKGAFNVHPARRGVHMREQGYGRVVNTSSAAGIFGNFGQANYGAAKMGLVGLTNVLARRGRALQHQGQRHRADCRHPHDRGDLRRRAGGPARPGAGVAGRGVARARGLPGARHIYSVGRWTRRPRLHRR